MNKTHVGDCRTLLAEMAADGVRVNCVVTSPPYWGLRDYGIPGQFGLERTWVRHVARMRGVFRRVRDALQDDGTLWMNYGDSYAGAPGGRQGKNGQRASRRFTAKTGLRKSGPAIKPKDLVGMPWRVALALQADGWYLRSDIIWHKLNPMPESVTDRPTKAHEYVFLLARSDRYYYDASAIREPSSPGSHARAQRGRIAGYEPPGQTAHGGIAAPRPGVNPKAAGAVPAGWATGSGSHSAKDHARVKQGLRDSTKFGRGAGWRAKQNASFSAAVVDLVPDRNARTVWTIATEAFGGAHFATFPRELVARCILAGSRPGDIVLDPLHGFGDGWTSSDRPRPELHRSGAKSRVRRAARDAAHHDRNAAMNDPLTTEIVVDNFAGGGGASEGIETALGRPVDIAINHNAKALAVHMANHPRTLHLQEDIRDLNPRLVGSGRAVGLGWFSPDCTYHSKARGGKPFRDTDRARRVRGLAGTVIWWARDRRPRVIMLENVEEFSDWGPLLENGKPDPARRGQSFRRWHRRLENLGYQVDMRELRACDYGAPTSRKRLFVIARCDGAEIVFPEASHGPWIGARPYRTAAECIDWSLPGISIFEREKYGLKPLVEATLRRIARGIVRYVLDDPRPFIVTMRGTGGSQIAASARRLDVPIGTISAGGFHHALVAPTLINTRNGEREGQAPRVRDIREPYATVTAQGSQGALVAAFLARHYGGHTNDGQTLRRPMHTITTQDHHHLVYAFLMKYYGTDQDPRLREPLHTITTKDRFGLVTVAGEKYGIGDIRTRMLVPRELARATSFPDSYILNPVYQGKPLSGADQVWMIGNAVPPVMAEALVRANMIDQAQRIAA